MATNSYAGFSINGLVGFGSASATGGTAADGTNISGLAFGGGIGYHFDPSWELSADYTMQSKSATVSGLSLSSSVSAIMANFVYHFAGDLNPLYVGVKLGLGMYSISTAVLGVSVSGSTSALAYGAQAGYDFALGGGLSIGPRVDFAMASFTNTVTIFNGLLAIKYWF